MDLTTDYLGLQLRSPLVPSASPLSEDVDDIRRMQDHGAAAVVLYSLFEEQLRSDSLELDYHLENNTDVFYEAQSFFPKPHEFQLGPEGYLRHIEKAKKAVSIPVIASLNGSTPGGWARFAKRMQEAGADAIELNLYAVQADPARTSAQIEEEYLEVIRSVAGSVTVPVAVKLAPYFTNLARMASESAKAGARGLVLFNRFYQPDIDVEKLEVRSDVFLSSPQTLRLPLRWIGILYKRVPADLAATGGIQGAVDVVKMMMVGASVAMLCAVLLRKGIGHLRVIEDDVRRWMQEHGYDSIRQMRGSMSQAHGDNPSLFERAQYLRALTTFRPEPPNGPSS